LKVSIFSAMSRRFSVSCYREKAAPVRPATAS
jgi:hypothetical protein